MSFTFDSLRNVCGFLTVYSCSATQRPDYKELSSYCEQILRSSRGPDHFGYVSKKNFYTCHARLSIIDSTNSDSNQPFISLDGRYILSFNGMIYNYKSLRSELIANYGSQFVTESDTEVILQVLIKIPDQAFRVLRGMYSFTLFDTQTSTLLVGRDEFGFKPLFVYQSSTYFIASSHYRLLCKTLDYFGISTTSSSTALQLLKCFGYIPGLSSLSNEVSQLRPGSYLKLANQRPYSIDIKKVDYLTSCQTFNNNTLADDQIYDVLKDSIQAHVTDYDQNSIALLLSGGLDSSLLLHLLWDLNLLNVRPFTFRFLGSDKTSAVNDESVVSSALAAFYGFELVTIDIQYEDFSRLYPKFLDSIDLPSIDGLNTFISTYYMRKLGYRVVLTGTGGDEAFFGYSNYSRFLYLSRLAPVFLYRYLFSILSYLPLPTPLRFRFRVASRISDPVLSAWFLFRTLNSPLDYAPSLSDLKAILSSFDSLPSAPKSDRLKFAFYEYSLYLGSNLLRDGDVYSMSNSVELRHPFVDSVLLKRLWSLNFFKKHFANRKHLLRTFLPREIQSLIPSRKTGFNLPYLTWISRYHAEHHLPAVVSNTDLIEFFYNKVDSLP